MKKLLFLLVIITACQRDIVPVKSRSASVSLTDVNIGTTANDGTGDPLRTAFQKVNANNALIENAFATVPTVTEMRDAISDLQNELNGKEDALGNPGVTGYVLSSTSEGTRSWVLNGAGGSGSKLNIINVTDYGVVADGVTDNALTLETLITDNNTYFFPRGTYLIRRADFVDLTNVRFLGELGTVFTTDGTGTDYQILYFKGPDQDNILIENIKFQITATQATEQSDACIRTGGGGANNLNGLTIRNCEFTCPNIYTQAISIYNEDVGDLYQNILIENCWFHDIGRIGVELYGTSTTGYTSKYKYITIRNNKFENTGLLGYGIAISLAGDYVTIENNLIINCGANQAIESSHGFFHRISGNRIIGIGNDNFWAQSLYYVDNVIYSNNIINIPQIGTALSNMTVEIQHCKNILISNNEISASGSIMVTDTEYGRISGNNIKSPYQVGIFLAGGVDSLHVEGNRIDMTSTDNIGGIIVNGNLAQNTYNVIENNYITAANGIRYKWEYMTSTTNKVIDKVYYSGSLTDGAPTATQINTITGLTPAVGAGSTFIIKDSDGTGLFYEVKSGGTSWYYQSSTAAL